MNKKDDLYKRNYLCEPIPLEDGEPCSYKGCERQSSHPCERCGRVGANSEKTRAYYMKDNF